LRVSAEMTVHPQLRTGFTTEDTEEFPERH